MSIVAEVNRLKDAKTAIKTAIEGKGVTVPDATMLEGMAALIDSIEAGGGGAQLDYGTFTPATDTYNYVVKHNLGGVPDFIVVWSSNASTPSTSKCVLSIGTSSKIGGYAQWYLRYRSVYSYFAKSGVITERYSNHPFIDVNDKSFTAFPSDLSNYASAGVTYGYVVIRGVTSW